LFGLLGDPVAHSVSPAIYTAAFAVMGVEATYVARRVDVADVPRELRRFAETGGGNVTLPHKQRVAGLLDRRTEEVEATSACNCFWSDSHGRLWGDNTDVGGFRSSLEHRFAMSLEERRVLLLGAGGAARAVLHACITGGARTVDVLNRTQGHAEELVRAIQPEGVSVRTLTGQGELADQYDLVVNATRLGLLETDPLPLDLSRVGAGAVLDLVYGRAGTRWTRLAEGLGVVAADGLDMLVRQAALSLRRWFPEAEPPVAGMMAAARRAIENPRPATGPLGSDA